MASSSVPCVHSQATTPHPVVHPVYVALGDALTVGEGADDPKTQSYPALLARHLPPGAHFLSVAQDTATLESALSAQLPAALAAHPTLVTVWLGQNELGSGTLARYRTGLDRMLAAFQHVHAHVFVLNIPDQRQIPAYAIAGAAANARRYNGVARRYNAAIATLAARRGAVVVDIYGATKSLWGHDEFVAADGLILTTPGYAALAHLVYGVLRRHHAL